MYSAEHNIQHTQQFFIFTTAEGRSGVGAVIVFETEAMAKITAFTGHKRL